MTEILFQMAFAIDVPCPPSANRIWRNHRGRTHRSKEYTAWIDGCALLFKARAFEMIEGPYTLVMVCDRSHGARDLDNMIKPINDLLQHVGVVANDRSCERIMACWRREDGEIKKGSTVTVRVERIGRNGL